MLFNKIEIKRVKYKKAVLSQGKTRDAAVNFDTYRIVQKGDNGTFMYTATLSTWTHLSIWHKTP